MNLHVLYLVAFCVACAFAAAPEKKSAPEKVKNELKPKREAPISGGSSYHGPSYKYLPPSSSAASGGYDSYSSHHGHHDHHGSYAEEGAYDFGGASGGSGHDIGHLDTTVPKVETYIVQTQSAHSDHGVPHSTAGYRYAGSPSSFSGGYSGHQSGFSSGHQSGFSGGYSHGHGAVHKVKAIIIPTHGYSSGSHGGSGYSRFGGSSGNFGYSKGLSGGSHFFSGSTSNHVGDSYAGDSYTNKHAGFGSGYNTAHSLGIGASSGHGLQGYSHGSSIPVHSVETSYGDSGYTGHQGGYSYEGPVSSHAHASHGVPSSSYGIPVNDLSPPYQSGESGGLAVQQPPSYAVGHKGLGHFSYAPSRPQALHTDYVDSNRYENSYANHVSHGSGHIVEKAPFKPSLFLGSSHDGGHAISSEYGAPAPSHGVSTQYSPPTSDGYDYPPPSVLYDAPSHSHSGAEAGPAQEPEHSYLPPSQPQSSYEAPAAPGDSYLPPHH